VDIPKRKEFGDFSTNVALVLANKLGKKPRDMAKLIVQNLPEEKVRLFKKIDIAGPGFINFFTEEHAIIDKLLEIENRGDRFGRSDAGGGQKVILEFVSANPTGYLHMGHARNACVGDAISNILKFTGYDVTKEFYINDVGRQIEMLGLSVFRRYQELFGIKKEIEEDGYRGDYIKEIALEIKKVKGRELLVDNAIESRSVEYCKEYAKGFLLDEIKKDLNLLGIEFDSWYSEERELHLSDKGNNGTNKLKEIEQRLRERNALYEKDGALWFRASKYGDTQDWVLIKKNGTPTYYIADIAYHFHKFQRSFHRFINLWGADHHSHVLRLKAAMRALDIDDLILKVVLIQFVRLMSKGKEIPMSKRTGSYVTVRDVINEVGEDVARFFLLMRSSDSHLDFDLDLAKKHSSENPVYYVQYAHARCWSLYEKAREMNINPSSHYLNLLVLTEEIDITKKLLSFPEVLIESSQLLTPHKLSYYLLEVASDFHMYYNKHRILSENINLSSARLYLTECIKTVLRNGLRILGISYPKRM